MVVEGGRRPALWSQVMAEAWREALSDAEVRELLEMRDWRSWLSIAVDWGTIGVALALVARWPNPLTMVVALFVTAPTPSSTTRRPGRSTIPTCRSPRRSR